MKREKIAVNVVVNILLAAVILGVVTVGFYDSTSNAFRPDDAQPIYRGAAENTVSLMVNVYWGTEYLDEMLATLAKYDAKCTFFVGGYWAAQNADMLNKMVAAGHEIGNHGYYHKSHDKLTYAQNAAEITMCGTLVSELCGVKTDLFAPPSGAFSENTLKAAGDNGYKTILWSRDTVDWRDKDAETVYSRATEDVSSGELVLMHPTQHTSAALPAILQFYADNGLIVATVGKNIQG